jgi:hypothetical protein
LVKRDELEKAIRFLKLLVDATDRGTEVYSAAKTA